MASGYWTGGPHPTDGLGGYPARDYGASPGTPVFSWDILRVERVSGSTGTRGKGFGGFNLYLKDRAGRQYFVTHIENLRIKTGDILRPGQQIANVGGYAGMAPHVHVGYQGGDPITSLGLRPEYLYTPGGAIAGAKVIQDRLQRSGVVRKGDLYDPKTLQPLPKAGEPAVGGKGKAIIVGAAAAVGAESLLPGDQIPLVPDAGQVVGGLGDFVGALRWASNNWDRVAEVLGGSVLILVGLVLMGRSLGVTKTKIEIVDKNLPGGMERFAQREAARAEQQAYTRAASTAGRRRALGASEPRRRRVRPLDDEPRARVPSGGGPSDEIPY